MSQRLISPVRRLGVLTGGGDVPGLNAAIKALVYRADEMGINVLGLRGGWEGITYLDRSLGKGLEQWKTQQMLWEGITYLDRSLGRDALLFRFDVPQTWQQGYIMPLTRLSTRTIDRQGGTVLQSTRTNGEPEVYDKHMAIYYANLIMSQVEVSRHGVMAAYRDGAFIATDIPGKTHPARRINPADYHATRYRPRFERITGPYRPQPAAEKP